jgi:ubiquinone/menaquinone biosynthesis C-methylase UbiE
MEPKVKVDQKQKEIWDGRAEEWERMSADAKNYFTRRAGLIRDLIYNLLPHEGKALDIGCATGLLSHLLADIGFDVYGIDISEEMIAKARDRVNVPSDHFRVCPADEIPFEAGYFQLVTAIGVFPYVKDYAAYIGEIARVLGKDGYVVAQSTNRVSIHNAFSIIKLLLGVRANPDWMKNLRNLIRTGLWTGGCLEYSSGRQVYSSAAFDRLFSRNEFKLIDQLNLYGVTRLDKDPLNRKGVGSFLARHLCWNHIGVYQKLPTGIRR